MSSSKLLLIIVFTLTIILCSSCGTTETEYDFGYNAGYTDGYNEGYDDSYDEIYDDIYECGYFDGRNDAADKAYDYLYDEYGIDDDYIIEYCREP